MPAPNPATPSGAAPSRAAAARELVAVALPLALFWALNRRALDSWWIRDDPCHLATILDHGLWQPFVRSIGLFLTPLLNLSLGIDFTLFGLAPRAFYVHHLASFSVLIVIAYAVLRAELSPAASSLASSLFVASAPAFAVAQLLMNRHYVEGLVLALLGLGLYRRSIASGRLWQAVLGAAFYLLASAAKEVFVPLVALLPFLAPGGRRRWRHAVPYAAAAGIYGLWRLAVLGWRNSLSAYGTTGDDFRPLAAPALLGLGPWQAAAAAAILAAAAIVLARRSRRALPGLAVAGMAIVAPLVPVAAVLEPRHLFLAAFAAAVVTAAALEPALASRRAGATAASAMAGIVLLLLALSSLTRSPFWRHHAAAVEHYREEGVAILEGDPGGLVLTMVNHSTFLECLARLRREALGRPAGPGFCGDPCFCARAFPGVALRRPGEAPGTRVEPPDENCGVERPLDVRIRHDRATQRMSWSFGPYPEGSYEVLLVSGGEAPGVSIPLALPRQGSRPYQLFEPLRLVARYRSPEGWQTYSSILTVEPDGEATAR